MADLTHAERQDIHHALESQVRLSRRFLRSLRRNFSEQSPQDRDEEGMTTICMSLLDFELSLQFSTAAAKAPFAKNENLANEKEPELTLEERLYVQGVVESLKERTQLKELASKEFSKDWQSTISSSQPKAPYFLGPSTAKELLRYEQLLQANAKAIEKLKLLAKPTLPRMRGH